MFAFRLGGKLLNHTRLLLVAGLLLAALASEGAQAEASKPVFDTADALQIFNRDVYFLDGITLRNPTAETPGDAQLYSVVGATLPLTWGEWQAASASSTVTASGGGKNRRTVVTIQLTGLVPNGIYSVFYGTIDPDSEHPQCPGVERTLPLAAALPGPDASSFIADQAGNATYVGLVQGDLLSATQVFFSVVYHFDGMTYHPFPNRGEFFTHDSATGCRSTYGEDAMRHLLILQKW